MQIGILEPDNFSQEAKRCLEELGDVSCFDGTARDAFLRDKEVVFVRLAYRIDTDFLAAAPHLAFVCSPTTGHTHLDEKALAARHVDVLSLRGETKFLETIRATPEHTLGLMLALLRNYRLAFQNGGNAHWDRDRCRGEELFGMPIGLIGYGRVGRRLANYLDAFGANVHWCDPNVEASPAHHRRHATVGSLIESSRLVALVASHVDGQTPIIGASEIALLTGRYFINTARGELVDEPALLTALENGRLAGVGIDVIADETGAPALDRWIAATAHHNVLLTPHIAGATFTSMRRTEEFLAEKLVRHLKTARLVSKT